MAGEGRSVRANAFAKINLTLRVIPAGPGRPTRADGYHELRTVFQSIRLHDVLTVTAVPGPLRIECDDPACPIDRSNLVWRAAEELWALDRRRGAPRDARVVIRKRIPVQAGLGGGSSDAAAALRAFRAFWSLRLSDDRLRDLAVRLGADVPYFLLGGTALGVGRGDVLFPLPDAPLEWIVIALPDFGVSTREAFAWFDSAARQATRARRRLGTSKKGAARISWLPASEQLNDLEEPVSRHKPDIARIVKRLRRAGAIHAAMSGAGSAVFGLFQTRVDAQSACRRLSQPGWSALATRTIGGTAYRSHSCPVPGRASCRIAFEHV